MDNSPKPAIVMTLISWILSLGSWFLQNIIAINAILQFIAFLFAIASAFYAIRYYNRNGK